MSAQDPDQDIAEFGYDRDVARHWPRWLEALRTNPALAMRAYGWWMTGKVERARNLVSVIVGERLRARSLVADETRPVQGGADVQVATFIFQPDVPIAVQNDGLAKIDAEILILQWLNAELSRNAASTVVDRFASSPSLVALYFDEAVTTPSGLVPLQKPPFDEDMLLALDYVGSAIAIRRDCIRDIGGLPPNREGTELRQLILALAARHGAKSIGHASGVIATRPRQPSTIQGDKRESRRRCSADHLAARNENAEFVMHAGTGIVRVHREIPGPPPRVSIIVPTRDRVDLLRPCIDSVLNQTDYPDFEVTVVDNESIDATTLSYLDDLSSRDRISVLKIPGPFNFSALNNAAARQARGQILVFLNNDTEVRSAGWLKELVVQAVRPEIGAVGAKLLYPDGRIQHGGIVLGGLAMARLAYRFYPGDHAGYMHRLRVPHMADAVTAACMAVTAEKFRAVGGFDETAFPVAYNDIDLCLKLEQAGYINLWTPYAALVHKEQATRGDERDPREAQAFARKWRARLAAAPVNPIDA